MSKQSTQQYNNYSKEYQKEIEAIKDKYGPKVKFRLLTGKVVETPTLQGGFVKKQIWNSVFGLPFSDDIIDPHSNERLRIGAISGFDENGVPNYLKAHVRAEEQGFFEFRTDTTEGQQWLDFLLTSNYFKNNPHRQEDKEPIYELVDEVAKSVAKMAAFTEKQTALLLALSMQEEDKKKFAAAMNWDENDEPSILSAKIADLADRDPKFFCAFNENNGVETRAALKYAITKGIVTYDPLGSTLSWPNGETFAVLETAPNKNYLDMFVKWTVAHPKGQDQLNNIKALLAGGKAKKAAKASKEEDEKKPPVE